MAIAENLEVYGRCIFPLVLNAVDGAVSGNYVNIISSDLELEMGILKRPFCPSSIQRLEREDKVDNMPSDTPGSLFFFSCFPSIEGKNW